MKIRVVFFGGYLSNPSNMKVWLASARAQRSDVEFDAIPYPDGALSSSAGALGGFNKGTQRTDLIASIESSDADLIYIVGHSSGCAIANSVDSSIRDHRKICLVALDGFAPGRQVLTSRPDTEVWSAYSGAVVPKRTDKNGKKSLHFDDLTDALGARLNLFKARDDCTKKIALHFSLVNSAASDMRVKEKITNGYTECKANLCWLDC